MQELGRWMLLAGAALAAVGAIVWLAGRLGFHGLPGDVRYQTPHVRVYFPIVTCIVLSVVLTLLTWLWHWFGRR